jgi:hypothetical protein
VFRSLWDKLRGKPSEPEPAPAEPPAGRIETPEAHADRQAQQQDLMRQADEKREEEQARPDNRPYDT